MRLLQRGRRVLPGRARPPHVQIHLAHAMMPEGLQPALLGLRHEPPHHVDPLVAPLLEVGIDDRIEELARVEDLTEPAHVPKHAVDLRARLVDVAEAEVEPRREVDAVKLLRVVLHHDPPTPIHGLLVFCVQLDRAAHRDTCPCRLPYDAGGDQAGRRPGDRRAEELPAANLCVLCHKGLLDRSPACVSSLVSRLSRFEVGHATLGRAGSCKRFCGVECTNVRQNQRGQKDAMTER